MDEKSFFAENKTVDSLTQYPKVSPGEVKEQLLFLADLKNFSLWGTNQQGREFLSEAVPTSENLFYPDLVHPEDRPRLQEFLKTCIDSDEDSFRPISLRLWRAPGEWEELVFQHRRLRYDPSLLLATAHPTAAEEIEPPETDVYTPADEPARALLNSLDQGYCRVELLFDLQQRPVDMLYLETNPAFEKLLFPGAVGRTVREFAPDFEPVFLQTFQQVLQSGEPIRFERQSSSLNKSWYNLYAFRICSDQKAQVGVFFTDISQNKLSEKKLKDLNEKLESRAERRAKELKENSELLKIVFNISNQGIIVFEPVYDKEELVDFRYLLTNKIVRDQYKLKQMEGKRFTEVNPDAEEVGVLQVFKNTMLTGKSKELEVHYTSQGFDNWFRITAKRKNGLLITTLEDITRRKLESQRLKENIRFKKHLTGASPDIIMIFNLYDENIRYINRDLAPLPGMKKRQVLGKKLMEVIPFIHPADRQKAMDFHQRVITASDIDIMEMEFRIRKDKGKYMWYNALGKVFMRNNKANVFEYMILLRNIDEQIATQKALLNAEKLSIKGEIARTLAHELRNPLASIGMASDILQKKYGETDKKVENYISIIKRSTKVLNKLVTELLTSSSYTPAVLEKKCLAEILEDSLKMARDRIYLSGIRVKKNYQGPYYIHADEEKLKVALLNLIVNASEAMDPNTGVLQLAIQKDQEEFVLRVTDNGCGLSKEQLGKLFDAFYTQKPDGIGVGLSSVKNILEEHDARIEVQSEPNKGTTFHLSFHCYEN